MADVFIYYLQSDQELANAVAREIQTRGLTVWLEPEVEYSNSNDRMRRRANADLKFKVERSTELVLLWTVNAFGRESSVGKVLVGLSGPTPLLLRTPNAPPFESGLKISDTYELRETDLLSIQQFADWLVPSPELYDSPPTDKIRTHDNTIQSNWVFNSTPTGDVPTWVNDIVPGRIFFWSNQNQRHIHQLRVGDNVVILVGLRPSQSDDSGGLVWATGLLAADASRRFIDRGSGLRHWPVLCLARLSPSLRRDELESVVGRLVRGPGCINPLSESAAHLIQERNAVPAFASRIEALKRLADAETIDAALKRYPNIFETTSTEANEAGTAARSNSGGSRSWMTEQHVDNARLPGGETEPLSHVDAPAPSPHEDAYVPFTHDGPTTSTDSLERGPLALFLARRLHLIWRQLNGGERRAGPALAADDATFIVHIDSPWGGGKTSFANFIARVLNPVGETLEPGHFLDFLAGTAPTDDTRAKVQAELHRVFIPDGDLEASRRWPRRARRPWIVARYNAWRDQHVQPPWWQIFGALTRAVGEALVADDCDRSDLDWFRLQFERLRYQLGNAKLKSQAITALCVALAIGAVYGLGGREQLLHLFGDHQKGLMDAIVAGLGVFGVALSGLVSVLGQSFAPDLDFTAEHKQIGVRDPIDRFRRSFDRILALADRPVLLIVDDIDRCDPATVVEVLRGFQTIIRSPRLFVLVLGDQAWIEQAHAEQHKAYAALKLGPETSLGARFVEKIFQLSFRLPAMSLAVRDGYARNVLGVRPAEPAAPPAAVPAAKTPGLVERLDRTAETLAAQAEEAQAEADNAVREYEARVRAILGRTEMGQRLTMLEADRKMAEAKAELTARASEEALDAAASRIVAATAGGDQAFAQGVANVLAGLTAALPSNPRQIKRILNSFSVYDQVGRLYAHYKPSTGPKEDAVLATRWWQLARWVVLATEWPETWRAVACAPRLLDMAYGDEKAGDADAAIVQRLRTDPAICRLLNPASQPAPPAGPAGERVTAEAVYEFNRLLCEPAFAMSPPPSAEAKPAKSASRPASPAPPKRARQPAR